MRQTNFSILKALAIILVVLSHAGARGWLSDLVYIFHVPAFFICAGYFFHTKYLTDERTFVVHRIKGLYLPFVRWSLVFLVLHNLLFHLGILSETYGNVQGGVTHPYTWHQFCQHLWDIVFNMSGYDVFLGGSFWFFRALLLASIGFLVLFKLLRRSEHFRTDRSAGWVLLAVGLLLAAWKVGGGLRVTGVAQGGYRELMGITFMAAGFLMRQYRVSERLTWKIALPSAAVLCLAATFFPSSMAFSPDFRQFVSLPVPAVAGFLALLYISNWLDSASGFVKRTLVYIGDRTLYVFAFHIVAFKVVSAFKVAAYGLPWEAMGCHPTIHTPPSNALWVLLYVVAGTALPLLWLAGYRRLTANVHITERQVTGWCATAAVWLFRLAVRTLRWSARSFMRACRGIKAAVKEILAASSTKDE